jgi:hypothetical protein
MDRVSVDLDIIIVQKIFIKQSGFYVRKDSG